MSYERRLALLAVAGTLVVLGANVCMFEAASRFASDDLHVGHGSVSFPPQAIGATEARR